MVSISNNTSVSSSVDKNVNNQALALARLSSGNRITQASTDVSGLAIGNQLSSLVTALRSALGNASQGSSLLQVADGSLDQQLDILERQKALVTQASNGSLSDNDRAALNQEFQGLSQQLDSLAKNTNFNGVNLLDGSSNASFAVGEDGDSINVSLQSTTSASLYNNQPVDISTQAGAQAAAATIDAAIVTITSAQATVGALDAQFASASSDISSAILSQSEASSQFLDADVVAESTRNAALTVQAQASIATQAQSNKLNHGLLQLIN